MSPPAVRFQEPQSFSFLLDGGLDLTSAHVVKKPGVLIAGNNVEMIAGRQGYGRPGGFERCTNDTMPSDTLVKFFEIKTPTGGAIAVDDLFTASGSRSFRSLDAIAAPEAGDIVAVATHGTSWAADDVCTGSTAGFTIAEVIQDTSDYTSEELRAYLRQAIEQTRDNVPEITGTGEPSGGFRLRGKNYVVRNGVLYRGDAYAWTAIDMPQVMYFYEGLSEIEVGDLVTDGTETATVASLTKQSGAWNYTYAAADQAAGYFTLTDATGDFTVDADIKKTGDSVTAVTNGTFGADTDWTKGTGWTISGGKANCSGAQIAVSELSQAYTLAQGRSIAITFTLSSVTAGGVTPFLGASDGEEYTADGTYTAILAVTTGDALIGFRADADFTGSIDDVSFAAARRASVKTVNADYTLPSGGDYKTRIYNFTNVADADSVYGVTGVGEAFEFDGTNYIPIFFPDFPATFPYLIDIHQERLHIGFPGGQWVMSVSGEPRVFDALRGSVTYSCGSELVGSRKIHGNALSIFTESSIWLLLGTGVLDETTQIRDWQFIEHDSSIGAVDGSVAEKGPAVFISGTEYRVVYPTQDTAGYKSNPIFEEIRPLLEDNIENISCALWCRTKSQHRLFLSTGGAIYTTFDKGKPKGGTAISLPIPVLKAWSTIEDSVEKIWFLSDTGYLYRMDSGNSFDDGYITGSFRVPFYSYGNNRRLKSFPQMSLGFDSPVLLTGDTEFTYAVNHAYGDPSYPRPVIETISEALKSAGGFYGANEGYTKFVWGGPIVSEILAYLDGYGPNMSILVTYRTKYDNPFVFMMATVDYIQLGLVGQET